MAISPVVAMALAIALAALCLAGLAAGFYLPGKDPLQVKVNKLTSIKTQLPYSYYSLPFCKPDTIVDSAQNLGEVLRGDRIENSPYTLFQLKEWTKKVHISISMSSMLEPKDNMQGRVISSGHLAGWDTYLLMTDDQIHWFSIVNSLMIILFLSGMVAMIMLRTLYRDISKYNQLGTQEEAQEETGWKLVHGVQFIGMLLVTMVFAVLGFLSPSNRGGLMTAMLLLWVFMGLLAGYSSSSLYKLFKGAEWKNIALRTAFTFPGSVFAIFFFLNSLIWGQKSSGAVPFTTMFALVLLWFGISVPLVFVGSFLGFKKPAIEDPVKTNKIPRQIPEQAWYMNPIFSILIGGILPFGAVFIELFILTSIWLHQFYYIFGF
uniref:Transmembrane 9 superfamily member n=1 Tax=Oryza nivara TaxID=4536 RepID=A0A0E0I9K1_ORYNI